MERIVLPELLDALSPQDPSALRSRRDLRRINAWMRHPRIMARLLQKYLPDPEARRIVELGAGDGHVLLTVAGRLRGQWPGAKVTLMDQLDALDPQMGEQFKRLGWEVRVEIAEASEWLRRARPSPTDAVICNLFLHQLKNEQLAEVLRLAAGSTRVVIALEPRRSWLPRVCGRLLWVIGCGPVTRHDAPVSIRAGFANREISALWPDVKNWELIERPIDLFTHMFIARRKD